MKSLKTRRLGIGVFDLAFRLVIWFLLTADLRPANIAIGVAISLLLPRRLTSRTVLKEGIQVFGKILVAIPKAYVEAFEMILRPHQHEIQSLEPCPPKRSPGLIFLDIFLITFTPKTIVTRHIPSQGYEVHNVARRKQP